jgi:cytochrome c
MRRKTLLYGILIFFGAVFLFSFPGFSAEPSKSEEAKQIVALVNSAAALVESKGKDAFSEFKKKDSKWYNEKIYVFVDGINGTVLVNPPSPEIEGKNLIDMKDTKGKALIREFIKTAKTKGSGRVDYWWPKPGEDKPFKKMSFIMKMRSGDGWMLSWCPVADYPIFFESRL